MLSKLRTHHIKRILWTMLIVIIPSFVLWGGSSFFRSRQAEICVRVGNQSITFSDFNNYLKMAECLSHAGFDYVPLLSGNKKPTKQDWERKGLEYVLLLWKADQERISVSDQEIVEKIKNKLFPEHKFEPELYKRALRMNFRVEPTTFERYVKDFIRMQKVLDKYVKVEIADAQVKDLYTRETQKAKIAYLFMPFEKFKDQVSVSDQEAQDFYSKNELLFKEAPKVKIRYCLLTKDNASASKVLASLAHLKNIDELKNKFNCEVKETDFIGLNDPIEGIGWQETINQIAFSLKKGKMSPAIETDKGYVIIEKKDEKQSFIPSLDAIKDKVIQKLQEEKMKEAAKNACEQLLAKINQTGIKDLKTLSSPNVEFKETNSFKYYDYIEGLGLEEQVSKVVFSLQKDEVYLKPIVLARGVYIVQLKDLTAFDAKDFEDKKEAYREFLTQQKSLIEKLKLLTVIEKEAKVKVYSILQQ
jgi:parvulin-like peptidyl-prolyl isomerase